jgi:hypothetical protein
MKPGISYDFNIIAPCGINCSICLGFLREKNKCTGCNSNTKNKPNHCIVCKIKTCSYLANTKSKLCYECAMFPCKLIKQIDKRYRTSYNLSLIGNLEAIKSIGLEEFLQNESIKWKCPGCGGTVCVHRGFCLKCHSNFSN